SRCKAIIVRIERFGNNDFITGIRNTSYGKGQRFRTTSGYDNIPGIYLYLVLKVVLGDFFPVGFRSLGTPIGQDVDFILPYRIQRYFWALYIGLPNIQMNDLDAFFYRVFRKRNELSDRGFGHGTPFFGNRRHKYNFFTKMVNQSGENNY